MTRKSASIIAAGLVLALLAGFAALSITFSGPVRVEAKPEHHKPIVRTVHRTKKVHRQAAGGGGTILVAAPQPVAGSQPPSHAESDETAQSAAPVSHDANDDGTASAATGNDHEPNDGTETDDANESHDLGYGDDGEEGQPNGTGT